LLGSLSLWRVLLNKLDENLCLAFPDIRKTRSMALMDPILTTILSGLVAGAAAKAKDVASEAVSAAYGGLKSLLIRKLGKSGAVQSVEDEPDSESAGASLAEALAKQGLATEC
jgi:hypothetical protein